ncbi:hypothetical protein, partial [Leucobacter sp. M11]|uniref:hypothetical protein n=1 Tax=Leucobacter sp. M11 TaxID=2993565 RepID=UPI002D7E41E3
MSARRSRRGTESEVLDFDELLAANEAGDARAEAAGDGADGANGDAAGNGGKPGRFRRLLARIGAVFAAVFTWLAKPFARFRKPKRPVSSFTNRDLINEAV